MSPPKRSDFHYPNWSVLHRTGSALCNSNPYESHSAPIAIRYILTGGTPYFLTLYRNYSIFSYTLAAT